MTHAEGLSNKAIFIHSRQFVNPDICLESLQYRKYTLYHGGPACVIPHDHVLMGCAGR